VAEMTLEQQRALAMASARARAAQAQQETPEQPQNAGVGFQDMVTRGITGGISDYASAGGRYLADKALGRGESFNDELKSVRQDNTAYRDANPVKAYGGEIGGGVVSPMFRGIFGAVDKGLTSAGNFLGRQIPRYAGYAAQGAVPGVLVGAANAEGQGGGLPSAGDVGKGAAIGGALGGAMGAAVPAITEVGAKSLKGVVNAFKSEATTAQLADDFKKAAGAAYKASEDAGVVISPDSLKKFASELPGNLKGFHPIVNEKPGKIISMLQTEADKPMTLSYLDGLRSVASGESLSRDQNDARLAGMITNKIDDFIENLKPTDLVAGGDEKAATDALSSARELWKTHAKLRDLDHIVETGENLNDQNWVKGQFRAIVKNPSKFNRYTDDEKKAIVDIARTGALEKILKIIPWRGVQMASTYAEPMAQNVKVNTLQNLIAGGGVRPPASIFGASPKAALGFAARLPASSMSPFMTGGSNQRP